MPSVLLFPDHSNSSVNATDVRQNTQYIALTTEQIKVADLQYLSPHCMPWDRHTWLIDLGSCYNYWHYQSQKQHLRLDELLRRLLSHVCQGRLFYAAMASHPWQALLLAKSLESKGIKGLVSLQSQMGGNLFRHISWNVWWDCCEQFYIVASKQQSYSRKHLHEFKQKIVAMQRAMKRLGVSKPYQINELPAQQIKRRFGLLLSQLWHMSFTHEDSMSIDFHQTSVLFPWQSFQENVKASKKTTLDHPIIEWPQIEAHLRSDLNQLCLLDSFKKDDRIINLEWRVVLQDLTDVPINIFFRHPHDLHRESPHHRTALLQVFYQFERFRSDLESRYHDLLNAAPAFIGWRLTIDKTLRVMHQQQTLFETDHEDINRLIEIENQLPVALEHYQTEHHWVAEQSFSLAAKRSSSENWQGLDQTLAILSMNRPLYIYDKPEPFSQDGCSAIRYFCERSMDQWWLCSADNKQRDYYRYVSDSRQLWLFQNERGHWFIHGIYG